VQSPERDVFDAYRGMGAVVLVPERNWLINNRIDDAYRAKYHGSPYLSQMIGARARSATVKVMPRETNA
jgi:hypothetical protein